MTLDHLLSLAIPAVLQLGVAVWWASRLNARVDAIQKTHEEDQKDLRDHIAEDKEIHKQIQGLLITEANFGGLLSNLNLEIAQIRKEINAGAISSREMLQLQLNSQSNDLIVKFRDMLHQSKKEIGDEMARTAARVIHEYMKKQPD